MKKSVDEIKLLKEENKRLRAENRELRSRVTSSKPKSTVKVPDAFSEIFQKAENTVHEYFKSLRIDPATASITANKERYLLVRASALSYDFLHSILKLYSDQGENEALNIGRNMLFDVAHLIGMEDARAFHKTMNLKDPVSKLSAGPVHFAYTGWASVEVLPGSNPVADDGFILKYNHPFSFEADSWIKKKHNTDFPVCIMNAGYSSGWCESSFGIPLTAVEVTCRAMGHKNCSFIMAPPHKIESYLSKGVRKRSKISIPKFLERKLAEEKLKANESRFRDLLEHATDLIQSIDLNGNIIFVNQSWKRTLGFDNEEVEGRNIFEFIHPGSHEHCKAMMEDIVKGKEQKQQKFEIALLTKNKRIVLVEGNVSLKRQDGRPVATTSILRNITERKIAEERVQQSLHEKEVLLKEIHHRVKNNLQIISSLLNLQADTIKDQASRAKFTESIGRIKSMAIIHELLYRSKNFSTIRIRDYLNELVGYISQTYNVKGNIEVKMLFDLNRDTIDLNKAIPCGIIINELVSNAFKYAFPGNKKGMIEIEFTGTGKRHYKLKVSDNGVGIPQNISLNNPGTLGMQLISSLVEQLDGKVKIQREMGTEYTIVFSAD